MDDKVTGNIQAAIDSGIKQAEATSRWDYFRADDVDGATLPFAFVPNGMTLKPLTEILDAQDARAPEPRSLRGSAHHQELSSFIAHVNRFKDEHSAVWADVQKVTVTAILDYHTVDGDPRWCRHRSVYACLLSVPWRLWTENDGKKMPQDVFAQFLEDSMADLASPVGNGEDKDLPMPSELLTMARNLVIRSKGEFSRSLNPVTGESALVCKNENESTSTKIPRAFLLGIPVFEAGALYRVEARMRMDMSSGRPLFSYALYQPELIKRDAFNEVRQKIVEQTGLPLFAGSPE